MHHGKDFTSRVLNDKKGDSLSDARFGGSTRVTFRTFGASGSTFPIPRDRGTDGADVSVYSQGSLLHMSAEMPTSSLLGETSFFCPLSSTGQCEVDDEGRDVKAKRTSLLENFPKALRLIAPDEAAAEAILSDGYGGEVGGYHRQFTEMALREIHNSLLSVAAALEARRRYLMRQNSLVLDSASLRSFDAWLNEESHRDLSEWNEEWINTVSDHRGPLLNITSRPPRFVAGMLWNMDDRFLLGGTPFTEEACVLQLRVGANPGNSRTSEGNLLDGSCSVTSDKRVQVRLLLREYTSVSRAGMGCMVQTFSIISDQCDINISRNNALPFNVIKKVAEECAIGAVTRAFSLGLLLPPSKRLAMDMRFSFSDSFSTACPSRGSVDELIGAAPSNRSRYSECERQSFQCDSFLCAEVRSPSLSHQSPTLSVPRRRSVWRQPLGDEVYLRYTNPKLYAWAMRNEAAVLTAHTNAIREFLYYGRRLSFRRMVRRTLNAVRCIQRFFRRSLDKKHRAVERMLKQWRQLELECRERLKTTTPVPTSEDRLDFVVGTVLWQHILTTEEFKLSLLDELFTARRKSYRKWCALRVEEEEEVRRLKSHSDTLNVDGTKDTNPHESRVATKTIPMASHISHQILVSKWVDVVHTRFGWYIEPDELLQESQRRLLLTLRSSILTIADVQSEIKKIEEKTFVSH